MKEPKATAIESWFPLGIRDLDLSWPPILIRFELSWLVSTNRDKTAWLASRLIPISCYCAYNYWLVQALSFTRWGWLLSCFMECLSPSFNVPYASKNCLHFIKIKFRVFYIFRVCFYYCCFVSSCKQLGVLQWKCIPMFVTALSRTSRFCCTCFMF
jgi:hypothetical protein